MESYRSISIREISEAMNLTVLNEGNLDLRVFRPNIYQVGYELTGFLATGSEELTDYINVYGRRNPTIWKNYPLRGKKKLSPSIFPCLFRL
ncbi:Uncharacterised protein [Fusobacterium necrophorum subsp. necrophorum]|nr:Uncharacterised protein [Fusobacterium necrophorum subsp. necrophorum]